MSITEWRRERQAGIQDGRQACRLVASRLAGKETCRKTAGRQARKLAASRLADREICRKACMQAGKQACRLEVSWLTGRD